MLKALQSPWLAALVGILVYMGATVAFMPSGSALAGSRKSSTTSKSVEDSYIWETFNPEVAQLVEDLKREKAAMAVREGQLNDLAARLATERQEINQITQVVYQLQREFDVNVLRIKEEETANLKKLAKMYASMAPDGAALVLKELDDPTMVRILVFMKEAEVAPILEIMAKLGESEPKRVAGISERLRLAINQAKKKSTL